MESNIPADLKIAGETKFTALVVQNLLDNARKYNRPGGTVRIDARAAKGQVELRVANTGRGIPLDAQPFIFRAFSSRGSQRGCAWPWSGIKSRAGAGPIARRGTSAAAFGCGMDRIQRTLPDSRACRATAAISLDERRSVRSLSPRHAAARLGGG